MNTDNLVLKSAVEQLAALRESRITAVGLLDETIEHSLSVAESINPFALILYERALEQAKQADRLLKHGKGGVLCGIPVSVKDSQWLADVRCANGSTALAHFVPTTTCAAIQRLEDAGAVIFAKTTCPEFCLSGTNNSPLYGATLNPWSLTRTPGGSSGGAGASIAAGAGSLTLGSDGGGSIRIPAAFCGIVGFKPSHGIVTKPPGFKTWESLVSYGPMTRSVEDAKLMFSVLVGQDADLVPRADNSKSIGRLIVSEDLGFAPVDFSVRATFQRLLEQVSLSGTKIIADNPGLPSSVVTWATVATQDMWQNKGDVSSDDYIIPEKMGHHAQEFIKFGAAFSEVELADAQSHRIQVYNSYMEMFKRHRCNILLTPTLGCEAFDHTRLFPKAIEQTRIAYPWLDWAGMLYDANLAGFPSCSIPMGLGDKGLPISLQIVGAPGHDWKVLETAQQLEKLIGWQHQLAPAYASSPDVIDVEHNQLAMLTAEASVQH